MKWYSLQRQTGHVGITALQDFDVKFIGERGARCLRTKAAETKWFLYFLCEPCSELQDNLPRGDIWDAAATAMKEFMGIIDHGPTLFAVDLLQGSMTCGCVSKVYIPTSA